MQWHLTSQAPPRRRSQCVTQFRMVAANGASEELLNLSEPVFQNVSNFPQKLACRQVLGSRPSRGILDHFGHCSCTESLLKTNRVGRCGKRWLLKCKQHIFHVYSFIWVMRCEMEHWIQPFLGVFKTWVFPRPAFHASACECASLSTCPEMKIDNYILYLYTVT